MRVLDADGAEWEYRLTGSKLEGRKGLNVSWFQLEDSVFAYMTPSQLRAVADVLEGRKDFVLTDVCKICGRSSSYLAEGYSTCPSCQLRVAEAEAAEGEI